MATSNETDEDLAPTIPPAGADRFSAKADDLDAMKAVVVDGAAVSAGLWLSYLFMFFYLLVAAAGVSPRDLLLESPVKLPFLNVDLPLTGFFWLGPALFLIVHAYTLLHFALLASKTLVFDGELRRQIPDEELRTRLRRQLPINIFVQFLAGPKEIRSGLIGMLLRLIAWISLAIGPIALFLFFQLQFLAYHSASIVWWQRGTVVIDLGLLWLLWPTVVHGDDVRLSPLRTARGTLIVLVAVSVSALFLSFVVATFPGEWLEGVPSLHARELIVGGVEDFVARKPLSPWSNRLLLPGVDVIDPVKFDTPAKMNAAVQTASLRMRNLDEAVLVGAVLRKVDLTGASLKGAQLQFAKLQGAELTSADLDGAILDGAQLQGAILTGAHLRGAQLPGVQAQGAKLSWSDMRGADLKGARLQGAEIHYVQMQGANLDGAEMQGAWFRGTQMEGASLLGTYVWRTDTREMSRPSALIRDLETGAKTNCGDGDHPKVCDWKGKAFLHAYRTQVSDSDYRTRTIAWLQPLLDQDRPLAEEDVMATLWKEASAASMAEDAHERALAETWARIGCDADGAPYVLQNLLARQLQSDEKRRPFVPNSARMRILATALLAPGCLGASSLPSKTRETLEAGAR